MRARLALFITILFAVAILDALQRHDRETVSDLQEFFSGWRINLFHLLRGDSRE